MMIDRTSMSLFLFLALCTGARLVILNEVIRRWRSPQIERILGRVIRRFPLQAGGNEIDAVRILGEAAPRIAGVIKVVRAKHVPADAPAPRMAVIDHLLHP